MEVPPHAAVNTLPATRIATSSVFSGRCALAEAGDNAIIGCQGPTPAIGAGRGIRQEANVHERSQELPAHVTVKTGNGRRVCQ
jgi:hypothetical protein